MSRIAIVIGVNKPKSLAPLKGAVADAVAFEKWAKLQDFETKPFLDDKAPVTRASIAAEVKRIVDLGTYSQVVIYFAGHGFRNSNSEVWLLSEAPEDPVEAISLEASVMASRESGLASVVFISDACRSIPHDMQFASLFGVSIFPNKPLGRNTRPEVDRLLATLPSQVAVEAADANDKARRGGIFTRELMRSYVNTPAQYVEKIQENGQSIEVVTNRKLKELVRTLVENAAFEAAPKSGQLPDFTLESAGVYIGRVERTAEPLSDLIPDKSPSILGNLGNILRGAVDRQRACACAGCVGGGPARRAKGKRGPPRRQPPASAATLAKQAIDIASSVPVGGAQAAVIAGRDIDKFGDAIKRFSGPLAAGHFETQTGFSVTGATVTGAWCSNFPVDRLGGQLVRVGPNPFPKDEHVPSASVLIEFDNGNGIVLPALRRYIGHIFVDGHGGVSNVNYVPSTNSPWWEFYEKQREQIEAFRATVAAAASLGVFRIAPDEAEGFAKKIRQFKSYDPTLGLYAAYAYASAGVESEVKSVMTYMFGDLLTTLFDVAMLAERDVQPIELGPPGPETVGFPKTILPFCPMLRQGWPLLAVRDAKLGKAAMDARQWLLPSLWTTFAPQGVAILKQAIERGDFK